MDPLDDMSDDERDGESDADKRAHHNALERKRRDHIKDSFSSLRDAVPSLQGEKIKPQASRAQILKKAAEYISVMRRKNMNHQQDIDDLKKQNKVLEEQIRALEKGKSGGFTNFSGASILDKPKSDSISSLDGISDSEGSEDHLAIDGLKDEECPDESLDSSMGTFEPPTKRSRGSASNSSSGSSEKTPISKGGRKN